MKYDVKLVNLDKKTKFIKIKLKDIIIIYLNSNFD